MSMMVYSDKPRSASLLGPRAAALLLLTALVAFGGAYFWSGLETLFEAWQLPEYSHGPLIPLLSAMLFLRDMKHVPKAQEPIGDRWIGVLVIAAALLFGLLGQLARIGDIVAYAMIVYIGGLILLGLGWRRGRRCWPAVLHLVFMLPLPGILYWKVSTSLQLFSSEVGVWLIQLFGIPVFLDGNIIDLGVYKLQVAEACSGLRYLYPVMSFSYIFAALYRGPVWHKAVLLISAAPITVLMNTVRIGFIGVIVNSYGLDHVQGLSHLLEGWVIFIASILILFGLVKLMILISGRRESLTEALDIDLSGLAAQAARLRGLPPSPALVAGAALVVVATTAWHATPSRTPPVIERQPLASFPSMVGEWRLARTEKLEPQIEAALGADDYLSAWFRRPEAAAQVEFFSAWYRDQTRGGIHSPEVCLPGGGWEVARIEQVDLAPVIGESLPLNRAIIQKGEARVLVYYWFEQAGGRTASDYVAKASLLKDAFIHGRTDGALVRLITPILPGEDAATAERRLQSFLAPAMEALPTFVPRI